MGWHLLNPSFFSKEVAWMLLARLSAACFLSWISSPNPGKMSIVPMMKYPWKLIWHLKMDPCKRRFLLETITVRFHFHVSFVGCTYPQKWWKFRFWSCEFTRFFGARNLWFSKILSQSRKIIGWKRTHKKKVLKWRWWEWKGTTQCHPADRTDSLVSYYQPPQ